MGDVTKHLERAYADIQRNDDEAALAALLEAWRERRVPRIADLVDRVSARITSSRGPIAAKTVKERTAKWIATAKKKDPADVGRLLATPWPGRWQDGNEVLAPLLRFPDDPRIALVFAKLVDETPYDTWTSHEFYRPLLRALGKILDLRTLPILEADLEREKSSYWQKSTRPMVAAAVKALKAAFPDGPPALSSEEEAALAKIEGLFAGQVKSERSAAKTEADLLRAIYESPDDDDPRAVYADWLTERGDPRGEFITLQLARHRGEATDAMKKRESALLRKHGKAWAGELDRVLHPHWRVFERGFLAEGSIELEGRPETPPAILSSPAWATFHTIDLWFLGDQHELAHAIVSLSSMRWVRALRGVRERTAFALARQAPRPRLVEMEILYDHYLEEHERDARKELADATNAFPSLRRLTIATASVEKLEPFLSGRLVRQLEWLGIDETGHPIGELARAVERHGLAVSELRARNVLRARPDWPFWTLVARRDDKGRFSRIFATNERDRRLPPARYLDQALERLGPDDLTELVVDTSLESDWSKDHIEMLEARLASFPALTRVEVPWERLRAPKEKGVPLVIHLGGEGLARPENLPHLWALVTSPPLSLSFDAYAVNHGAHASFSKKDRLAEAAAVLAKKRTHALEIYRKDGSETCALSLQGTSGVSIRSEVRADPKSADEYVAWLARLLDTVQVASGSVPFVGRGWMMGPRIPLLDEPVAWIHVLGPKHAGVLPFDGIEALSGSKERGLADLRVVRTKRNAILVTAPTPEQVPAAEKVEALQIALFDVMWSAYRRAWGFVPHELAIEVLGPPLAKHGFVPAELSPLQRAMGHVLFVCKDPSGARGVHLRPALVGPAIPELELRLVHAPGDPNASLVEEARGDGRRQRFFDASDGEVFYRVDEGSAAQDTMKHIASRIDGELVPWFSESRPPARRR